MKLCIINGEILKEDKFVKENIWIENDIIVNISTDVMPDAEILDASGKIVSPGFIDLHVHLREPGLTHKETIESGTMAAAAGGFTQICAMPNTKPVIDNVEVLEDFYKLVKNKAKVKVHSYAAITSKLTSDSLVDFKEMSNKGAFAFTNDGVGVQTAGVMYEAMIRATKVGKAIAAHCEDETLLNKGVVHEGIITKKTDLKGIPSICESTQIARDVLLAEASGCHYHVCHVSTKESIRVIRDAKKAGIYVTAEVTPHHLLLCDEDVNYNDTSFKMNPPLRSREDKEALLQGLKDGTIDCIATDHAPHAKEEKAKGFVESPFGIIGLEHAFGLLYDKLVLTGWCTLVELIKWLSIEPAKIFNMEGGQLAIGEKADIVILDLESEYEIKEPFYSLSQNTPFMGCTGKGSVVTTIVNGKKVFQRDK